LTAEEDPEIAKKFTKDRESTISLNEDDLLKSENGRENESGRVDNNSSQVDS
jgi:hypothetical protein